MRKYGLTIDNLLAAEVVTADGEILHVDDHTYPDLFWAIRGGGGNFGVVTRFQFQLHPLATVYGGELVLPATPETLRAFVAAAEAAPEELSSIANVMPAPPMPFLPAEVHGKLIIFATLVYAGDAAAGEQALAPFRAIATPLADMLRPMAYPEVYPPDDPDYHPVAASRTLFIDRLDQPTADLMFDYLKQRVAPFSVVQVRALGGAYARVPVDATAYAHRDRRIMVNIAALYDQPHLAAPAEAWVGDFAAALQRGDGTVGAYVNFLSGDGTARIREAYPGATWERLRAIKAHYDPTNLFHLNHNIPPAE